MPAMDVPGFGRWLERYAAAWRSNDPKDVASLFADDAEYSYGPYRESARGREEIVRRWVDGGVQAGLDLSLEPLAVDGDRGVAHWRVAFDAEGGRVELDGILVCDFDAEGRCVRHLEWSERRST
jgi:SnoaL-like domain